MNKWYFDELYWAVFVRPCLAFARLCGRIDKVLIDGLVNGSALRDRAAEPLGRRLRQVRASTAW